MQYCTIPRNSKEDAVDDTEVCKVAGDEAYVRECMKTIAILREHNFTVRGDIMMTKAEIYDKIAKSVKEGFHSMRSLENDCIKTQYSKKQISRAGKVLIAEESTQDEKEAAMVVLNDWRARHSGLLDELSTELRGCFPDAIVVQRLKRLDSIIGKLERFPEMDLYRMQDLGGCRVILDSIDQLYKAIEYFKGKEGFCTLKREYDYVQHPKKSGYRSYHLVYQSNNEKEIQVEIQFRTKLEHVWATAVEVMGIYTKTALKSSMGDNDMLRFFACMSSIMALKEGTATVPETATEYEKLAREIKYLDEKLQISMKLRAISSAIMKTDEKQLVYGKLGYYVLRLDYEERFLTIHYFRENESDAAIETYNQFEAVGDKGVDIVLVAADSLDTVREAYPNYFTDVQLFLRSLEEVLSCTEQKARKSDAF